jgi:putative SOS response-associated peptidase YedK
MCGRFSLTKSQEEIKRRFQLDAVPEELIPRYNIAPTQMIPVILNESPRQINFLRWGFVPQWATQGKPFSPLINARAETITEKPAFRQAIARKRCLIIADGFYEWQADGKKKKPYWIVRDDREVFAFAGVWDISGRGPSAVGSCAIITAESDSVMRHLHDRMPMILPPDKEREWLTALTIADIRVLLKSYVTPKIKMWEVSPLINSPGRDTPDLINPIKSSPLS